MSATCNTCKFAIADGGNLFCRRAPPQVALEQGATHGIFPPVNVQTWCGEYKRDIGLLFKGHIS